MGTFFYVNPTNYSSPSSFFLFDEVVGPRLLEEFSPGNKKDAALSASSFDTTVRRQSVFLPSCCIHP
jgi:hypothetical protein